MNLREFPLLTDENIAPEVVTWLRSTGFDIFDIVENGLMGMDDEQILDLAHNQGRIVVTQDSDFGTLAIPMNKPYTGIIFLKPGHILSEFTIQSLSALLRKVEEVVPPFIIVVHHGFAGIRIRYRQK